MPAARSSGRRVLVLGGTSEIGLAIVAALARAAPREVALLARDPVALTAAAAALGERPGVVRVLTGALEAREPQRHAEQLEQARRELGGVDLVILAVGVLGARGGLPADIPAALEVLETNVLGAGSLLLHGVQLLCSGGGGTMIVLSSVAAERVRAANAVYGASKAALDGLAAGVGDSVASDGVDVLVVRPGFVRTRMTAGLPVPRGATSADAVAEATVRGLERGAHTVWAPPLLRWVMLGIRLLPRRMMRLIRR